MYADCFLHAVTAALLRSAEQMPVSQCSKPIFTTKSIFPTNLTFIKTTFKLARQKRMLYYLYSYPLSNTRQAQRKLWHRAGCPSSKTRQAQ